MADNVNVTPGSGAIIATRDAGAGIEVQRVIPNTFSAGVATDVSASAPLPIVQTGALPTGTNALGSVALKDGTSGLLATVAAFHNADNQVLPANSYGLNTGGVAQLLNRAGNLDRQRETGVDGISALGVATGTAQLKSSFSTTSTAAAQNTFTSAGLPTAKTIIVSALSGTTARGSSPWSIQAGSVLTVDTGAAQEVVVVTAVNTVTPSFTAVFANAHTAGFAITGAVYNESRDATVSDGSSGQGFAAGATYLFNSNLNSGSGGWEAERSATGELDGAAGTGAATAVEYKWNGVNYDRARSLQGKGYTTTTLTAAVTGGTTQTLALTSVTGITAGQYLILQDGTAEQVQVAATYAPTTGAGNVALTAPVVNNHANSSNVSFEVNNFHGPQLNGFTPVGIGIEEEALYDPITDLYYVERAATQDAMAPQNLVAESLALYNGTTGDRARSLSAAADGLGVQLAAQPSSAPVAVVSAANAAVSQTYAAVAGQQHRLTMLTVSYSGTPTGGNVTITDGGTTVFNADVTASGMTNIPLPPGGIKGTVNSAMVITLAAGGATVVGKVNAAKLTA